MRLHLVIIAAMLAAGCTPTAPVEPPKPDPTKDASYQRAVEQLKIAGLKAKNLQQSGKPDEAAAVITQSQPLINTVLSAPSPTLEAMEGASDLDDVYGRMLLANRHYGWARSLFQKNSVRWESWKPQTASSVQRKKQADEAVAECDREMTK